MQQPRTFLLDTSIPIVLYREGGFESMPREVQNILESPQSALLLSVVSHMEIAIKHSIGKLSFPRHEVTAVCTNAGIEMLPFEEHHSFQLFDLPRHHGDPFDRALISTAIAEGIPIVSSDAQFRRYKGLEVIW